MGSVEEMFWASAEDLFQDVDLDALLERQKIVLGGDGSHAGPPMVLVHTGKTSIGICIGPSSRDMEDLWHCLLMADNPNLRQNLLFSSSIGEIFE